MAAESPFHVLAVDDCLLYRKVIEKLLKKSSFRVTVVDSGAKALEFLRLNQVVDSNDPHSPSSSENHQDLEVNLILTDYCMPGMTGYDLLKKIKETPLLRHLPVVIMSSENVPSRITECLDEGAEEFLLKPVREADLNRLKPLMMRTKLKNQVHEQIRKPEIKEDVSVKPEDLSAQEQEQEQEQQEENQQEEEQQQQEEEQLQEEEEEENQQEEEQQPVNNKRKEALEEGITQDRSRPRYDEITSFV